MRVCIVPEYPMSLMTGGLQVQAVRTFEALSNVDSEITAELFDWSKTKTLADVYHFVGLPRYLSRITELVRQADRPYVVTLLFGSNRERLNLWTAATRQFINSQVLRRRERFNAVAHAARIIAITEADAEAATVIYGVRRNRIDVIPNGVAKEFFESTPELWRKRFGPQPFVLCVGAIQQRKGQLLLAETCNELQLPLVLLGPVLPGETSYAKKVEEKMKQNEKFGGQWLRSLSNNDLLLHSAYAACRVFALFSASETQPLSVMEAMASAKPVLLLRAPYTDDQLFRDVPMVGTPNVDAAATALKSVWNSGRAIQLASDYTWPAVAERLGAIYNSLTANVQ